MIVEPLKLTAMACLPTKTSLETDIQEMEQDALNDPAGAKYFELKEETFKNDLAVLNDPKNANLNPHTLAGIEDLSAQMEKENSRFTAELKSCIAEDPSLTQYGWTFQAQKWVSD